MVNPFGFGVAAFLATAAVAVAGGDDEKKKNSTTSTLDKLSATAPQGGGPTIKAAAGKGISIDAGEEFSFNLKNRVQIGWQLAALEFGEDTNNFDVVRARTSMSGHLYKKEMTYKLQLDWAASDTVIRDAWFRYAFMTNEQTELAARFGAQKPLFGREATGTSEKLEFVNRALASRVFSNTRQVGAVVTGEHMEKKLHWNAGVVNGDVAAGATGIAENGNNSSNTDNEPNYVFGIRYDHMGDMGDESYEQGDLRAADKQDLALSVGAGLQMGNNRAPAAAPVADVESMAINLNLGLKASGFHVLAEYFDRTDDVDVAGGPETDSSGYQLGVSYTLQPSASGNSRWAFGARYSAVKLDDAGQVAIQGVHSLGAASGDQTEYEFMVTNYYKGHNLKTHLGWRHQDVEPDAGVDASNDFIELLFQFVF
jgi:hypothetical protein